MAVQKYLFGIYGLRYNNTDAQSRHTNFIVSPPPPGTVQFIFWIRGIFSKNQCLQSSSLSLPLSLSLFLCSLWAIWAPIVCTLISTEHTFTRPHTHAHTHTHTHTPNQRLTDLHITLSRLYISYSIFCLISRFSLSLSLSLSLFCSNNLNIP